MRSIIMILNFSVFLLPLNQLVRANKGQDETDRQIIAAIGSGHAENLSDYLNAMVDCGILGNGDSYSKAQAIRIIQDFFDEYPVKSLKITKQGTSTDGSLLGYTRQRPI